MKLDPKRRKEAEAFIIKLLDLIDPSGINSTAAKKAFIRASDDEFVKLKDGIPVYNPTGSKVNIDHIRNIKIARLLGEEIEQRVWYTDQKTGLLHRSRHPHLNMILPGRRQTQMQEKKLAVANNDRVRDKLSGQVVGPSKASGISFPETYLIYSDGNMDTLEEFLHGRGGNDQLQRAFYQSIRQTGKGRIHIPGAEKTSSKATRVWSAYFTAMHIGNNIGRPE